MEASRLVETVPRTVRSSKGGAFGKRALLSRLLPVLLTTIILIACSHIGCAKMENKGGNVKMKTYMIGRFKVDMPENMELAVRTSKLRHTELEEYLIPQHSAAHQQFIDKIWNDHLTEIMKIAPLMDKEVIKEKRDFPEISKGTKGVIYHGNYVMLNKTRLDVLFDAGPVAVLLKHADTYDKPAKQQEMIDNIINIAKAYRAGYPAASISGDWFYLERGAVNLPYLRDESLLVEFTGGPYDLNLSIDMNAVDEVQHAGLLQRMAAAIMMNLAPGLKLDKIRSGGRTVGGLKGDEIVMRGTEKNNIEVRFGWEYSGKEESGEYPEIQITMESPDGNIEEKLKIWDAILDSFQPAYKRNK